MKKSKRGGLGSPLALAAMLIGLVSAIVFYEIKRRPVPTKAPAIEARLELVAGEVLVDQRGASVQATGPTALLAGASVQTKEGSRALIRLPDGSSAFLRAKSLVKLGEGAVLLDGGEYWLDAPSLERRALVHHVGDVKVTAVDAGMSVKRDGDEVAVYVARGMAVVTGSGGRVEVHAGEIASVSGDGAPNVEALAFWDDWTGGMADFGATVATIAPGSGEIYAIDHGGMKGSPAERLQIKSQSVRAVIRDGLAETEVDQTFFNPAPRNVEGWYWFTIPADASVTSFAVETDGQLVEGELIERRDAAKKYSGAKRAGHAPAILEWIDNRTYRARIFPIAPSQTRRVVLRYMELLPVNEGTLTFVYPMASRSAMRIGEFSLSVDLGAAGRNMSIATLAEARVEMNGERVTMRRSGYTPRVDFQLEAQLKKQAPAVRVSRFETGGDGADYLMARYTPDVVWNSASRADVVLVVDTSAGSDDNTRRLATTVAEAILRALSSDDAFTLVALDVAPRVLHPKEGLADADDAQIATALEALASHAAGGATDLASLFDVALSRVHEAPQPAIVYVGDGLATSGEQTGEQLIERLRRGLSTSRARLFTVPVGSEANRALLGELARAGGGESLDVSDARFATATALQLAAAFKVPTLTDFELDLGAGLDEPLSNVSGKVTRGEEVVVLARTHHDLPKHVTMRAKLGGELVEQELDVVEDKSTVRKFVPRLWAAAHVERLLGAAGGPDVERGRIAALGIEYGLMTPFTSILALESEAAYARMGIQRRRSPLRGVKLTSLDRKAERRLNDGLDAMAAPAIAWGCSKESADRQSANVEAPPPSPPAGNRYGVPGHETPTTPAAVGDADAPSAPVGQVTDEDRSAALKDAEEFGMIGLLDHSKDGSGNVWGDDIRRSGAGQGAGGVSGKPALRGLRPTSKAAAPRRAQLATTALGTCSAAARRPVGQRALVWRKRLKTARDASELVLRYVAAMRACELMGWRAERTFLSLMQQRITTEGGARLVLSAFASRPDVQRFIARLILRRAVDERLVAAVEATLFGAAIDWPTVDRELTELEDLEDRIARLRTIMARAPDDPNGIIRLVELLATAGKSEEALALGRRLRDRGLMTVRIARQLGDVLARAKHDEEAVRTYSEIVEFDPSSGPSRQLLGDIYLARGWYGPAYRQYRTLADAGGDSLAWLRLANAAAGAGRIDEALRIDKRVATAQGRPGPDDPRRWARVLSASRVAALLADPPKGTSDGALQRKLKELQLMTGEGTLVLVTWPDLTSDVVLTTLVDGKATALGEAIDAAPVGLSGALLSSNDAARATLVARLRSVPRREPLNLLAQTVRWDGKTFSVTTDSHELPAGETRLAL